MWKRFSLKEKRRNLKRLKWLKACGPGLEGINMAIKLNINQRVQLRCDALERDGKRHYYSSRIEEEDADFLYIAEPLDGTVPVYIPIGETVEVVFNDEKGTYHFQTVVLGRVDRNIRLLRLAKPHTVEKTNRRDYFRLQVFIPFTFKILPEEKYRYGYPKTPDAMKATVLRPQITEDEASRLDGVIKDISGGGVLVAVSEKVGLKVGDYLEMWLPLGYEEEPIYLWGEVVRTMPNPDATKWDQDVGVFFSKINERDRDKIIAHILNLQRDLLQRGALQSEND
jgi:c-di-GMP-binding flagellar brake protein YcgR